MSNVVKTNGSVPLGYEYGGKHYPYKIVREKACLIKRIFELGTEYYLSPAEIAQYLNNSKCLSKLSGKTWTDKSIRQILKNEAYKGTLVVGKRYTDPQTGTRKHTNSLYWKRVENHHEIIVSQEVFERAQVIFEMRKEDPQRIRHLSQICINEQMCKQIKEFETRIDELAKQQDAMINSLASIEIIKDKCNSFMNVVKSRMEGRLNDK